jgi:crotonobetainyl-CoA:carnitine CoA-transferase CaiB-like acyl-CoA transferase|tara:strand:+ start:7322 stop:8503 length:1182 start_codon:yes stop_codon:yes gene_type:complete
MAETAGALAGVRVVDLTDERGIYGAKLLADLGADVVRPEPPGGDPLRARGPHRDATPDGCSSLWHAFFASNRRFFSVDLTTEKGCKQLQKIVERADILLVCDRAFGFSEIDFERAQEQSPKLVIVNTSSFGPEGPWKDYLAPDLVAGAFGGSVATTGDKDTPPLKTFGELNFMLSGAYTAIAALSALYSARETGAGQMVDVPVNACIASCLEHVLMWVWYHERMMFATGPVVPRQAGLHWAHTYEVMQAKGGSIMVTPTPDMQAQLMWMVEEDLHEDLLDEKYTEPGNHREFVTRFMGILRKFVGSRDVEELFFEAQERHSPYGWVLPIDKVAENPQLEGRDWWATYKSGETETRGPGAPYRFSATPWSLGPYDAPGTDSELALAEIGWGEDR